MIKIRHIIGASEMMRQLVVFIMNDTKQNTFKTLNGHILDSHTQNTPAFF